MLLSIKDYWSRGIHCGEASFYPQLYVPSNLRLMSLGDTEAFEGKNDTLPEIYNQMMIGNLPFMEKGIETEEERKDAKLILTKRRYAVQMPHLGMRGLEKIDITFLLEGNIEEEWRVLWGKNMVYANITENTFSPDPRRKNTISLARNTDLEAQLNALLPKDALSRISKQLEYWQKTERFTLDLTTNNIPYSSKKE